MGVKEYKRIAMRVCISKLQSNKWCTHLYMFCVEMNIINNLIFEKKNKKKLNNYLDKVVDL